MINPQTYQAMQALTTMAVTVMAINSMYQLALLGVPLAAMSIKPTTADVMQVFKAAGKKYGARKITRNDSLRAVAVISFGEVEVNPQMFLENYMSMYEVGDWQYWKRYVYRVMLHEVKHTEIDRQLDALRCWGRPLDDSERRVQWLLHDWYIESILLKDYPIPPLGDIHKDDWDPFGGTGQEGIVLVIMGSPADLEREFGDTTLPEIQRVCLEVKEIGDICKVYKRLVGLYDIGYRQALLRGE